MKIPVWITVFLAFQGEGLVATTGSGNKGVDLETLLPSEIQSWSAKGEDSLYNTETIFNYINGAGEVYLSYNFQSLLSRRYVRENGPDIIADIFDMGASENAFGVFTHDLEGEVMGVGRGSNYKGGLLSFWKDRFFVSLFVEEETAESRSVLLALGRKIASSISQNGHIPKIVSHLPVENLLEKGVRYFHTHQILNIHFFVAEDNILLLDKRTDAALGRYKMQGGDYYILLVRYPDGKKALQANNSFKLVYMPEAAESGIVRTEDNKWTAIKLYEQWVFIIFNSPSNTHAEEALGRIERKVRANE